jgi:hypothetical protein
MLFLSMFEFFVRILSSNTRTEPVHHTYNQYDCINHYDCVNQGTLNLGSWTKNSNYDSIEEENKETSMHLDRLGGIKRKKKIIDESAKSPLNEDIDEDNHHNSNSTLESSSGRFKRQRSNNSEEIVNKFIASDSSEKNILFIVSIEGWYKWPLDHEEKEDLWTSTVNVEDETPNTDLNVELPILDFAAFTQDLLTRLESTIYPCEPDEFKKIFFESIELKEIKNYNYSNTPNNVSIQSENASNLYIQIKSKRLAEYLQSRTQRFKEGHTIICLLEFLEASFGLQFQTSKKMNYPIAWCVKSNVTIVSHDCSMRWLVGDYDSIKQGQWYPSRTRCINQQILDYELLNLPAVTIKVYTDHLSSFAAAHDHCSQNYKYLKPDDPKYSTLIGRLSLPSLSNLYVCRPCWSAVSTASPSNSNQNGLKSTLASEVKRFALQIRRDDSSWKKIKESLSTLKYHTKGRIHTNGIWTLVPVPVLTSINEAKK